MPSDTLDSSVFSSDMFEFLILLQEHQVHYMIVGGEAVIFYGHVRLTGDIDFFYDPHPENALKLFSALESFWDGSIPEIKQPRDLEEPGLILQFGVPPNRIDLLNKISGVSFEEAWPLRKTVTIAGDPTTEIYYLGLENLLKNKLASGRNKDLEDVSQLKDLLSTELKSVECKDLKARLHRLFPDGPVTGDIQDVLDEDRGKR